MFVPPRHRQHPTPDLTLGATTEAADPTLQEIRHHRRLHSPEQERAEGEEGRVQDGHHGVAAGQGALALAEIWILP